MSHAEGTHAGTETLYARGVSLEDFLSSDIELLLEYFFSQSGTPQPSLPPSEKPSRALRARPAFFDFCVHHFTISPQTAHDQRIACEGFTCKAFTQSSPFPSPQPSLYELVRSDVKGEHRKSELGEVRVRDRDVCVGACPRDENAAAGEGKIERVRRKVEKCGTIRFDCRDGGRTR